MNNEKECKDMITRETVEKIYLEALDKDNMEVPAELMEAYEHMDNAFSAYLEQVRSHCFYFGYITAKKEDCK